MPNISAKGKAMPDSPIRKLAPFANAAKERGTRVIHLNIGQPDIATPEVAMDAVRNVDRTVLEYSPSEGFARYRERLARYYNGVGVDVTATPKVNRIEFQAPYICAVRCPLFEYGTPKPWS